MHVAVAILFLPLQFYTGSAPSPDLSPSISLIQLLRTPVFYIKAEPPGGAKVGLCRWLLHHVMVTFKGMTILLLTKLFLSSSAVSTGDCNYIQCEEFTCCLGYHWNCYFLLCCYRARQGSKKYEEEWKSSEIIKPWK